jgi:hypothetical protein
MKTRYIIENDNICYYYLDRAMTILHREDGPAVYEKDINYRAWYINGVRHREDGPAVEYDNIKCWFINGNLVTESEHKNLTSETH